MNNKLIILCRKHKAICSILFFYFGTAFTWILSIRGSIYERISMSLLSGLIIGSWVFYKNSLFLEGVNKTNRNKWILALCSSTVCAAYHFFYYYTANFNADVITLFGRNYKLIYILIYVIAASTLPIYLVAFSYLLNTYSDRVLFLIKSTLKNYGIIIIILFSILTLGVLVIYTCFTDVFYNGYNAVYSADSLRYIETNVYMNLSASENDIRQPLFGLVGSMFTNGLNLFALIFRGSYPVLLGLLNVVLILMGYVLLADLLELNTNSRRYFFVISILTYPALVFSLIIEQYTIPFVTLMIFATSTIKERKTAQIEFIAASGSLLTSGVLFPFLREKNKNVFIIWIQTFFAFFCCFVITGRLPVIWRGGGSISSLLRYTGVSTGITFTERLYQYSNFVWTCFFKPDVSVIYIDGAAQYVLAPVKGFNYAGILLLIGAVFGFLLNKHLKIARFSFYWLFCSIVLLCVIGWGSAENNLVLYSLYFSWSVFTLLFLLFEKLLNNKYKPVIFGCIVLVLLYINVYGVYDMVKFGMDFYTIK